MKLSLNVDSRLGQTGYTDIGFVKNLDAFAEDGECSEIYSPDILNYIHYTQVDDFIKHVARKVKRGGKLILGGNDCIEICKMMLRGEFNSVEFNRLIYGNGTGRPKENTLTLPEVVDILKSVGYKILKKRLDNYVFTIEAERL